MKSQIIIDEFNFINGYLNIVFKIYDDEYREDNIDESIFEEYIEKSGKLEYFEDCWDGVRESHYTKDYLLYYENWRDEYCESSDILDFLYYYYENNKLPETIDE